MTNALDELRRLLDASTPEPWEQGRNGYEASIGKSGRYEWQLLRTGKATRDVNEGLRFRKVEDAALIVFLRNHAEDLLAVARAAEKARNAIRLHNRGLLGTPGHAPGRWPEERRLSDALARLSPTSEEGVDE